MESSFLGVAWAGYTLWNLVLGGLWGQGTPQSLVFCVFLDIAVDREIGCSSRS